MYTYLFTFIHSEKICSGGGGGRHHNSRRHSSSRERLEMRWPRVSTKLKFFLLKINFLYVLDRFDALISKIILKK
jgi:hypothetical protein